MKSQFCENKKYFEILILFAFVKWKNLLKIFKLTFNRLLMEMGE